MTDVETLVSEIIRYFPDMPVPQSNSIYCDDEPIHEYLAGVVGCRWNELGFDNEHIIRGRLSFMNANAFVYYLPAYLLRVLESDDDDERIKSEVESIVLQKLFPPVSREQGKQAFLPSGDGALQCFANIVDALNQDQKGVIAKVYAYLECQESEFHSFGTESNPGLAYLPTYTESLNGYWRKYL